MNNTDAKFTKFYLIKEKVREIVLELTKELLFDYEYDSQLSNDWSNKICQQTIHKLSTLNRNFKFIVNCTIVGKGVAGLDMAGLCYWDNSTDGFTTVKWEGNNLTCVVNVYGCAL